MRLLLLLILIGVRTGFGQVLKPSEAKHWRMYDEPPRTNQFSLDSVVRYRSIPLSDVTVSNFLSNVDVWPKDKWSTWQGYYLCTAEFPDSGKVVLLVSRYGGFFYDIKHKQYYSVSEGVQADWLEYFNEQQAELYKDEK